MVRQVNPPFWVAGRVNPKEIGDASGERPHLARGQTQTEQVLDHQMSAGVTAVRGISQCQLFVPGEPLENGCGLVDVERRR